MTPVTPKRSADARLALQCMFAESAYDATRPAIIAPAIDARLAKDWTLRGYVTAQDAVFRHEVPLGTQRVYYGWLLESIATPGGFLLVIRGTAGGVEWAEDACGLPTPYGSTGAQVHRGFYELYRTFLYAPVGGIPQPALSGVTTAVSKGALLVTGHSLGSALATYWVYELADVALLGSRVSARVFASPRPGDGKFADLFAARVKDADAWAFEPDVVPKVPYGFGYTPLHCVQEIEPAGAPARIKMSAECAHHAITYCRLLSPDVADGVTLTERETALYGGCVLPAAA